MKNDEKNFHVFYDFMNGGKKHKIHQMNEGRNDIIYRVNFNRFILISFFFKQKGNYGKVYDFMII